MSPLVPLIFLALVGLLAVSVWCWWLHRRLIDLEQYAVLEAERVHALELAHRSRR